MVRVNDLHAISPLDGRYSQHVHGLQHFFSEFALLQLRTECEVQYLLRLVDELEVVDCSSSHKQSLLQLIEQFSDADAERIKALEDKTHHDVKAVEYFLQEKCREIGCPQLIPWIHFGLTSEDVNACAYGLALLRAKNQAVVPSLKFVIVCLLELVEQSAESVMLARTHGQPAVPTTLGKELLVFAARLEKELTELAALSVEAKCSGAVGNWNAVQLVMPEVDWRAFAKNFITSLGLTPNLVTTQIIQPESYSKIFQLLVRVNGILLDLTRDCWQYISDGYLVQQVVKGEVGSSTMPQKVNPIDFENSEGNAGLAIALLQHFVEKLPVSRLQRDLSDSTVKRSFGVALAHSLLAFKSVARGLKKVSVDAVKMKADLEAHPEVLAEAVQTALRFSGKADAYELLKELSRGKSFSLDKKQLKTLFPDTKQRQLFTALTPSSYIGLAPEIVRAELKRIRKLLVQITTSSQRRKA